MYVHVLMCKWSIHDIVYEFVKIMFIYVNYLQIMFIYVNYLYVENKNNKFKKNKKKRLTACLMLVLERLKEF